ncbi:MAG: M42 family metallopeptidase [Candidatus Brocadiaceae bacterium]|jgi:endoglucanase
MNKQSLSLVEKLSQLEGVPGFEDDVRKYIQKRLKGTAEFEMDNLGSIICRKAGDEESPRLMLPAHMDEIGFMVKDITDEGFIRFAPLGGWLDQTLLGHVVTVKTRKGDLGGVIGCTPPHMMPKEERNKVIKRKKMFIDVGARDKEHAQEKLGVRIGDPIVPVQSFERVGEGEFLLSKAWDDRVGCALMIDTLKALRDKSHPNTVYGVGTTQEEVGTRGAKTAADVVEPDFCVVLDVGPAADVPGVEGEVKTELGKGPIIYVLDAGTIAHHRFNDFVLELAEQKEIPHQLSLIEGGATDARAIHLHARGVPSVLLGIPTRYIHSHAGLIHTDDYDATLKLVQAVVMNLSPERAETITRG